MLPHVNDIRLCSPGVIELSPSGGRTRHSVGRTHGINVSIENDSAMKPVTGRGCTLITNGASRCIAEVQIEETGGPDRMAVMENSPG